MTMSRSQQRPFPGRPTLIAQLVRGCLATPALLLPGVALAQTDAVQPEVVVIGTVPLPDIGLTREQIPAPVQVRSRRDIQNAGNASFAEFMNRELGSVHVNDMQGNPFQADVSYRGYTASPLLGTPQGLSVYVDGVRQNQPFGDVVSWDLIPKIAISSMTLMPGSNPLFGLNTLGGAISLQTKDGRSAPGTAVEGGFGSHSRRSVSVEHGGFNDKGLDWYVAGTLFKETGWRNDSPSDVRQLFGKLGWQDARTDVKLSIAHMDNEMNGNGLQEQRFLDRDWASVYTKPDITKNKATSLNLLGKHSVNDKLMLSGNAYYRDIKATTFNGDINEGSLDQAVYNLSADDRTALAAAGYTGVPAGTLNAANTPFPFWRCIAQGLQGDEPGEKCNGLINRTETKQSNYGLSGQATLLGDLGGMRNQFTGGAAYDRSKVSFSQTQQLGYLNPDRSITGIDAFADGVTGGVVDGELLDNRVKLDGRITTWSLFGTNTLTLREGVNLTVSGRYNHTRVTNSDQINPGGGANSLDGNHTFNRFNPAVGITWQALSNLNVYAGYNEGSRAPTAIELGCANPEQPCKLPNAMAGDPPLKQVVTRTVELGARGKQGDVRWNAGVFRAENTDDILFVADDQAGFGYFRNFGKTRRQGLELGASTRMGPLSVGANYTFLDATYQSTEVVNGSSNSTNSSVVDGQRGVDGTINIRSGDRIPLIPRQMAKVYADYAFTPQLTLGGSVLAVAGSYARGNENNAHQPDGTYYLGSGKTGGYAVLNLSGRYEVTKGFQFFGQVNNLLDRKYATAAQLGPTGFNAAGNFIARPFGPADNAAVAHATFYAPGAPRTFWLGARYAFN